MAEIWFDVDTALSEVPVNIFPLVDDTDFKSRKVAVAYNAAGMDLVWNFVTTAGAMSQTAVTPTDTGGAYDWVHIGDGMYTIEIPASGGATINNDTEGFGWFTGMATGVLPWRSPIFGFRAAGINNTMIDSAYSTTRGLAGTALPDAAADAAGGLPISDAGGLDLDAQIKTDIDAILADTGTDGVVLKAAGLAADAVTKIQNGLATPTNITAGTITTVTNLTNLPAITANWLTAAGIDAGAVTELQAGLALEATLTAIKGDGWTTETLAAIDVLIDAIKAKTDLIPASPAPANEYDARMTAIQADLDNTAQYKADVSGLATAVNLATVDGKADAIKLKTDNLPSDPADQSAVEAAITAASSNVSLSAAGVDAILDEVVVGTYTMRQLLKLFGAKLHGTAAGGNTDTITYDSLDGTTTSVIVETVDEDGNRTVVLTV